MAFKTQTEIVQGAIDTIGLVSGTSVQTYTEPIVEKAVQQTFDMLFRKHEWDHLCEWITATLDGSTGRVADNLGAYTEHWEHIASIFIPDTDQAVVMPIEREHLHVNGSQPLYYVPIPFRDELYKTKLITVYPITATGNLDIRLKIKPDDFNTDSVVPMPSDIMEYGTAWNVLANDGINPDATNRAQTLFDTTYRDYVNDTAKPQGHGPGYNRRRAFVMGNRI